MVPKNYEGKILTRIILIFDFMTENTKENQACLKFVKNLYIFILINLNTLAVNKYDEFFKIYKNNLLSLFPSTFSHLPKKIWEPNIDAWFKTWSL